MFYDLILVSGACQCPEGGRCPAGAPAIPRVRHHPRQPGGGEAERGGGAGGQASRCAQGGRGFEGPRDRAAVGVCSSWSVIDATAPLVVDLSLTVSPVGWFQSSRMNNVTGSL